MNIRKQKEADIEELERIVEHFEEIEKEIKFLDRKEKIKIINPKYVYVSDPFRRTKPCVLEHIKGGFRFYSRLKESLLYEVKEGGTTTYKIKDKKYPSMSYIGDLKYEEGKNRTIEDEYNNLVNILSKKLKRKITKEEIMKDWTINKEWESIHNSSYPFIALNSKNHVIGYLSQAKGCVAGDNYNYIELLFGDPKVRNHKNILAELRNFADGLCK